MTISFPSLGLTHTAREIDKRSVVVRVSRELVVCDVNSTVPFR
jgi:hypothetical protein